MSDTVIGRNSCLEALRSGRKVHSITMLSPEGGRKKGAGPSAGATDEILAFAKERNIPIEYTDRATLDKMADGANHQGVIVRAQEYAYSSIDEIIAFAREKGEAPFLVLLDGIEDPHNLGAIIRTAECAGAHGVVIPKNRAATVNETVLKTSAGAAEYIRCARVTNLSRTIDDLKEQGLWIYACDMGEGDVWDTDMSGAVAIVIGNEGKGVSRLVRERCDGIISMPLAGKVGSLNASNAAAIAMYEVVRQRR